MDLINAQKMEHIKINLGLISLRIIWFPFSYILSHWTLFTWCLALQSSTLSAEKLVKYAKENDILSTPCPW